MTEVADALTFGRWRRGLSIAAALERLPEEQQLAVSLVLIEGLSYQEAADIMEVPVGTLTSRLSRGREALAAALGGKESSGMSTESSWDNARIHAYVDGALDAETAARLEADSRTDAALAARIAQQRDLRTRLRAEFDPVLQEPIPQQLRDVLAASEPGAAVTPIGAARKTSERMPRQTWSMREWGCSSRRWLAFGALLRPVPLFRDSTGSADRH